MSVANYTVEDLDRDLASGPYAWPGGYPRFFLAYDGEALSFAAVQDNVGSIREAITDQDRSGWQVIECPIHWEGSPLICAHTNEQIESAYGEVA